ncbi:MAG: CPXCG motif-containing cysteine-rich protein [Gammaproteobacteria bacterium]|nr:CPXCG motif-containing cysteine-rich protein [Gammaproteobacteria bacterium]
MPELLVERSVTCPSCWEKHDVVIDLTTTEDHLIEDCQVCCNPMRISFQRDADLQLSSVSAQAL